MAELAVVVLKAFAEDEKVDVVGTADAEELGHVDCASLVLRQDLDQLADLLLDSGSHHVLAHAQSTQDLQRQLPLLLPDGSR